MSFSVRFALVLVVLGALIAGTAVAIPLAVTGAQRRQTALDRAADRAAIALNLLRAEEGSLAQFSQSAAAQLASGGDPTSFLARLSTTISPDDVVGLVGPPGDVLDRNGVPVMDPALAWLGPATAALPGPSTGAARAGIAADTLGSPWIVAASALSDRDTRSAVVARPLTEPSLAQLAVSATGERIGLLLVSGGRAALDGAAATTTLRSGDVLPGAYSEAAVTDGPSRVVQDRGNDVAVVSSGVGGGYRILVTTAVAQGTSLLSSVAAPIVIVTTVLILLGLAAVYLLVQRDLHRPLQRLDRAVAALARDDFSVPVRGGGTDEVSRLSASFEDMRRELEATLRGAEARAAIATDLTVLTPVGTALDAVCLRLRATTRAGTVLIVVETEDRTALSLHSMGIAGEPSAAMVERLLRGDGPLGAAARMLVPGALVACPLQGTAEHELGLREVAAAPLRIGARVIGGLLLADPPHGIHRHDTDLLALVADQVAIAVERERVLEAARIQANTDGLTGLHNRRFLTAFLDQQINVADRADVPLTILMLDVDRFKSINDTFGHEVGDLALQSVTSTLLGKLRRSDLAARLGGDEFVVVMSEAGPHDAAMVAEKLREAVAQTRLTAPGTRRRVHITVSIGVATRRPRGVGVERLLTLADTALYEAKRTGRDRVSAAPDENVPVVGMETSQETS